MEISETFISVQRGIENDRKDPRTVSATETLSFRTLKRLKISRMSGLRLAGGNSVIVVSSSESWR